jgi:hypothetical protein
MGRRWARAPPNAFPTNFFIKIGHHWWKLEASIEPWFEMELDRLEGVGEWP